jgi:hypothetical protein
VESAKRNARGAEFRGRASVITVFMLGMKPLGTNERPTGWMKPIPAIAELTTSAITAVPHDLLYLRPLRNADIPQCPVIEFRQGSDGLFDLSLPAPMLGKQRLKTAHFATQTWLAKKFADR